MTDDTALDLHPALDLAWAQGFAAEWVAAWNAHDVEAVLAHYDEDVVFTSPIALEFAGRATIDGKAALREYWTTALRAHPDLHFELTGVTVGVDVVVISYRNHQGRGVSEALVVEGRVVTSGFAAYGAVSSGT